MSRAAAQAGKRISAHLALEKAAHHLRQAADALATVGEALKGLEQARGKISEAHGLMQGTTLDAGEGKPKIIKRDALPAPLRRKAERLLRDTDVLMAAIKAHAASGESKYAKALGRVKKARNEK